MMNRSPGDPLQPGRGSETSLRAPMVMMGVIFLMAAALFVDPNKVTIEAMGQGAIMVGVFVTIGSMAVEILKSLIEGSDLPDLKTITISHSFLLIYPLISFTVLLVGALVGFPSTGLFIFLIFVGGGLAFLSGGISRYALDQKQGPAFLRGCLWLGVAMILIVGKIITAPPL